MMNIGIYCIEHAESGKKYVGSTKNFTQRWQRHRNALQRGRHHSVYLQRAWDKYGEASFVFRKLLVCSKDLLVMYEQRCIDGYSACDPAKGFNSAPTAGQKKDGCTGATREKLRAGSTGRVITPEWRARMSAAGKRNAVRPPRTLETKLKIQKGHAKKLDAGKAAEIRALRGTKTRAEIAALYGVSKSMVGKIVEGRQWVLE